jgi:hypothetical protein
MQPCYPATQFQRSRAIGFFVFGLPPRLSASGAAKAFARAYLAIGAKICGLRAQRDPVPIPFRKNARVLRSGELQRRGSKQALRELGSSGDKTRPDYSGYQN